MAVGLSARAWLELLRVDLTGLKGFQAIQRLVVGTPTRPRKTSHNAVEAVADAFRTATTLYFRPVQCLQRSAVVTRMLRQEGVPADMVIGCHLAPLKAHAWVEVAGEIVSGDQPGVEHYVVLDRW